MTIPLSEKMAQAIARPLQGFLRVLSPPARRKGNKRAQRRLLPQSPQQHRQSDFAGIETLGKDHLAQWNGKHRRTEKHPRPRSRSVHLELAGAPEVRLAGLARFQKRFFRWSEGRAVNQQYLRLSYFPPAHPQQLSLCRIEARPRRYLVLT